MKMEKQPLRVGETVTYVSATPYGNALLPAVVYSIHGREQHALNRVPHHIGLRVFTDMSGGSEWPVSTSETDGPTPGHFYRTE
jgi:hypothetical protein